ncbi:MGDG synthase family glycosyltransferase [Streptomyces sp. TP-A0874]|uniref:MGDG synthase family glycosyltransferase n=1 Tax=Streptomyces sp. TP-A0874 TaxID=549819 RepID=UPI0008530F17|nr:galactosyldiacylglycerol synthase [Streptomyces sp. TP-A0874]
MERRFLIISASMGAGHDAVADELARRLRRDGHRAARRDVLALLPAGVGAALRGGYRASIRHLPSLYSAVYAAFFVGSPHPDSAPLAALAGRRLMAEVERWRPDAVVSTFHLAAQVTGRLRQRGRLQVPSTVVITDFAAHRQWLHPGNDLHLCVTEAAAARAREGTGRPAAAPGPVVSAEFRGAHRPESGSRSSWREVLSGLAPGKPPVLISAGAWGTGSGLLPSAELLAGAGFLPVLLCGRDRRLLRTAARRPGVLALGWVNDLPELMASACALVDNAAGQTAVQALASGLPVIGYRPLPGHGAEGVYEMAAAGVSAYARDPRELLTSVRDLASPGPARERLLTAACSVFAGDTARLIRAARTAATDP